MGGQGGIFTAGWFHGGKAGGKGGPGGATGQGGGLGGDGGDLYTSHFTASFAT